MQRVAPVVELRSFLEETLVLREAGSRDVAEMPSTAEAAVAPDSEFVPLRAMVEEAERRHIRIALERTGGSVMKTSELLGTSRKTLWEKDEEDADR